jgi:tetrathionate reductase subunit B
MTMMNRRTVLGLGGGAALGVMLAPGIHLLAAPAPSGGAEGDAGNAKAKGTAGTSRKVANETLPSSTSRWAMLIDVNKCPADCTACVSACRKENNVPLFGDPERDVYWIRKVELRDSERRRSAFSIPVLCNHCEEPPCVHVCPTEASFVRKDGIVLIDEHRCIGCRYCMIACPYKARSFVYFDTRLPENGNPKVPIRGKGVVEKCTFCVHRLDDGLQPACVEACASQGGGAMMFGDINDPKSEIALRVKSVRTETMREDLGLKPHVHYQGL